MAQSPMLAVPPYRQIGRPHARAFTAYVGGDFAGMSHQLTPHVLMLVFSHVSWALPMRCLVAKWHGVNTARYKQAVSWLYRAFCT